MEEQIDKIEKKQTGLYLVRGILALCTLILIFYPMFGGSLLLFGGTFVYFSYFLATFFIILLALVDGFALFKSSKEAAKRENILFMFISAIICFAILQGRYIINPIMGIIYFVIQLLQAYLICTDAIKYQKISEMTKWDWAQRILFYLTMVVILVGNQPFEQYHIPVASSLLMVLTIISLINFINKYRNIK